MANLSLRVFKLLDDPGDDFLVGVRAGGLGLPG